MTNRSRGMDCWPTIRHTSLLLEGLIRWSFRFLCRRSSIWTGSVASDGMGRCLRWELLSNLSCFLWGASDMGLGSHSFVMMTTVTLLGCYASMQPNGKFLSELAQPGNVDYHVMHTLVPPPKSLLLITVGPNPTTRITKISTQTWPQKRSLGMVHCSQVRARPLCGLPWKIWTWGNRFTMWMWP